MLEVAVETLDLALLEMRERQVASALRSTADPEGGVGKFYVWRSISSATPSGGPELPRERSRIFGATERGTSSRGLNGSRRSPRTPVGLSVCLRCRFQAFGPARSGWSVRARHQAATAFYVDLKKRNDLRAGDAVAVLSSSTDYLEPAALARHSC